MENHFEVNLLYYILGFHIVENLIEIYITWRQVKVYEVARKVPKELTGAMSEKTFESARSYGLDKAKYSVLKNILMSVIVASLEIYLGFLPYLWRISHNITRHIEWDASNEYSVSMVFLLLMSLVGLVKDMPFTIYSTFVLEEKHGFNKQTAWFFIKDQTKSLILSNVLSLPISYLLIWIVHAGGTYFFIWMWGFAVVFALIMATVYPLLIAPLFDKYTPLPDGALRTSIEQLASRLHFPLTHLYVVEGSKRSAHSNAYFYGLWFSKRIVLFDTLLINKGQPIDEYDPVPPIDNKGCKDSEVLAVLAHELGHWKLGHVTKNIFIMQIHMLLMFGAFGYLFSHEPLYQAFGFPAGETPVLIGMLIIFSYIMAAYNAIISFGMTALSRRFEYQADAFAKDLGYASELINALNKLNVDNLGFPVYDWLYSTWNHSHPTMLQRMARLKDTKKTS